MSLVRSLQSHENSANTFKLESVIFKGFGASADVDAFKLEAIDALTP